MTLAERQQMADHEAMMRKSPRELFPDIGKPAKPRKGICRGCGKSFTVKTRGGPNQKWCTSKCRIKAYREQHG